MTRREFTSAKRELEQLEHTDAGGDEFHRYVIGGDPDRADRESGLFQWDSEAGVYKNDAGHEIPPSDVSDSEFGYTIMYGDGEEDQ